MDRGELVQQVALALAPPRATAIRVAWLFGSQVAGTARPGSDLDVAVVYEREVSDRDRESVRRRIVAALTDILGSLGERTDVVDIDRVDSAVAFRAIRDGERVVLRSNEERIRAEARVMRLYDDDAPKRALFRRAALYHAERLARGGAMIDADIVARRPRFLTEALGELGRPEAGNERALATDRVLRAAVERWLQIAIEACIDIAEHVVATQGWTPSAECTRDRIASSGGHGQLPAESIAEARGRSRLAPAISSCTTTSRSIWRASRAWFGTIWGICGCSRGTPQGGCEGIEAPLTNRCIRRDLRAAVVDV